MVNQTPEQKSRLARVLLVGAVAAALLLGYVAIFDRTGRGMPCVLHLLTGLRCGACGMTRAAAALMRLDFAAAFGYNALWPLFGGYLLWVAVADAVAYVRRGRIRILPGRRWVHGVVLALVVGYGVLRNFL